MLGLTVGIHELGHFLAAVTRGIHVTKFSIGFGPTLLKWQVRPAAAAAVQLSMLVLQSSRKLLHCCMQGGSGSMENSSPPTCRAGRLGTGATPTDR